MEKKCSKPRSSLAMYFGKRKSYEHTQPNFTQMQAMKLRTELHYLITLGEQEWVRSNT